MFELRQTLPEDLEAASASLQREWRASGKIGRLWDRDAALWTESGEEEWLGWLDAPHAQIDLAMMVPAQQDQVVQIG